MRWVVAAILILLLSGCETQSSETSTSNAPEFLGPTRALSDAEKKVIADEVRSHLRDPEAAKFKWLPYQPNSHYVYCGYVDEKHSWGHTGRVMFATFVSGSPIKQARLMLMAKTDPHTIASKATREVCVDRGYP